LGFTIGPQKEELNVPMPAAIRRHNERDKSEAAQDDTDDEDHFPDRVPTIAPFNSMHGRATQSKGRRQTQSTRPNMIILPLEKQTSVWKDADRRGT